MSRGESIRLEHWTNAVEQAEAAAARLLAGDAGGEPFAPVPFVWSDQYDLKIQAAGHIRPDDEMYVCHGSLEERRFVAIFGRAGRLTGALALNRVRALMACYADARQEGACEAALDEADREADITPPPAS